MFLPRQGRHHRRGRPLRFRCHQGGFLSFLLRGEPLALPVVSSLVFGVPVDHSATEVVVSGCAGGQTHKKKESKSSTVTRYLGKQQ